MAYVFPLIDRPVKQIQSERVNEGLGRRDREYTEYERAAAETRAGADADRRTSAGRPAPERQNPRYITI